MSTSILKMMGLYLSPAEVARLCVPDALSRLEELDGDRKLQDGLVDFVHDFVGSDLELTMVERIIVKSAAKHLAESLEDGSVQWHEVINSVRCYDTYHGQLLGNLETARERRLNCRMDWLEQSEDPTDWHIKIQTMRRPIHSWGGYRCRGPVSEALAEHLDDGVRLPAGLVPSMLSLLEDENLPAATRRVHGLETFDTHFRPEVDPLSIILAMSIGLFKPEVTRQHVEEALVPSIITTWL